MQIFFPKEEGTEIRATILPEVAKKFTDLGIKVVVETEIGSNIFLPDESYQQVGATISVDRIKSLSEADIVCRVNKPRLEEISSLKRNAIHISFLDPFNEKELVNEFAKSHVSAISMELVPRITRAQKMDALSSQANLAGYSAVIEASRTLNKSFPMMMTAAGTISPSRVFVIGVGVAGLQAIATAKRLGARVEAFDTRPVVEEQVKSLGAKFVQIDIGKTEETDQGYAKELSADQIKMQQEGMKKICGQSDVVITTAQVFGRPAPRIVSIEMVEAMKPGSVIVDMAVSTGGNVEGSIEDEYVFHEGVTIIGMSNLPGEVAMDASQVYGSNVFNMIEEYWDAESKEFNFDLSDEILKGCVITNDGEVINSMVKERM
ncbi:Re/Si-specific NAD(P)(+) transhydrogenase subunit alpha [Gammaproteobacteria bacterium]|nr:Re/Si-specific NAD(P)(+) transhydrogenase subunit alpha [Gammaproteobacteria bacterium]|tara:strand:- start:440 stop:1567 length:1128 start_codon:yes stop_codon:yes gene_type:complete